MRRNSANSTNEKNEAIIFNFLLEISCSMPMQHSMLDGNQSSQVMTPAHQNCGFEACIVVEAGCV